MNTTHDAHDVTDDLHRAECPECAALWTELERISVEAAHLPALRPARDLWQGIAERIRPQGAASGSAGDRAHLVRPFFSRPSVRLAIAASLLVAVTSTVTWQLATRGGGADAAPTADLASGVDVETAEELHLASFQASVQSMDREIAELETIVADRRETLDPRTIAVLEENLRVIDRAISESRAALVADPGSRFLSEQFTRVYSSKLTLLRDAATLPTGI